MKKTNETHTPLPWSWCNTDSGFARIFVNDGNSSPVTIAKVYATDEHGRISAKEFDANVRLIVRAVNSHAELLAATQECERLLANITQLSQPGHAVQLGDLIRCADAAAKIARAAIAKAGVSA